MFWKLFTRKKDRTFNNLKTSLLTRAHNSLQIMQGVLSDLKEEYEETGDTRAFIAYKRVQKASQSLSFHIITVTEFAQDENDLYVLSSALHDIMNHVLASRHVYARAMLAI